MVWSCPKLRQYWESVVDTLGDICETIVPLDPLVLLLSNMEDIVVDRYTKLCLTFALGNSVKVDVCCPSYSSFLVQSSSLRATIIQNNICDTDLSFLVEQCLCPVVQNNFTHSVYHSYAFPDTPRV